MTKSYSKLFLSSAAGLCIGIGSTLFILSKAFLGKAGLLVGACLFPVGLITICLMKWHLYTGKVGLVLRPETDTWSFPRPARLAVILLGNIIGAAVVGFGIYGFTLAEGTSDFALTVKSIGASKSIDFTLSSAFDMLLRSTVCGIFVYLAVRFFGKAKTMPAKIFGVFLPIMIFVYFGFQHCIANVTYMTAASHYIASGKDVAECIFGLVISVIGNSAGALAVDRLIDR